MGRGPIHSCSLCSQSAPRRIGAGRRHDRVHAGLAEAVGGAVELHRAGDPHLPPGSRLRPTGRHPRAHRRERSRNCPPATSATRARRWPCSWPPWRTHSDADPARHGPRGTDAARIAGIPGAPGAVASLPGAGASGPESAPTGGRAPRALGRKVPPPGRYAPPGPVARTPGSAAERPRHRPPGAPDARRSPGRLAGPPQHRLTPAPPPHAPPHRNPHAVPPTPGVLRSGPPPRPSGPCTGPSAPPLTSAF
ncbi:hypothetical protein OK006_2870 [Actinobacteria bacterium OK006]|nr:hypothetical protein OK006_2870 [Actinobacteria bacterium OK006]